MKLGVVIETNPTSNLTIGKFSSLTDYYALNLSFPEREKTIITVNTDDPIVFNTCLSNEYGVLYDLAIEKGAPNQISTLEWLDHIRENGLRYSFIRDTNENATEMKQKVDGLIATIQKEINPQPA
ncbi:MAG: hypothetical protein A2156_13400 [Deltaproteobacteria bacterium RBG_16_48_10]|nr:MAG: hypothetical protein A2156_13400 [Deltaproteobacteria bacterium RBG_16_48_10]